MPSGSRTYSDVPSGAEAASGAIDHGELAGHSDRIEIGRIDDQTEVIEPAVDRHARDQIDDRAGIDAHRRERHLTAAPLVDACRLEPEEVAIPGERTFDVRAHQDDVIETRDGQRGTHARILPGSRTMARTTAPTG